MNPTDLILKNFEKVSSIPRGTKFEAGIRQWLMDWAAARNYQSNMDAAGNLVISAPASPGHKSNETIILQGHLDMVWQKTSTSKHDFEKDPIRLVRDGDWIKADGTTLGADNGIGIALMMSLVEDETVQHPPLELLLTVEEEIGLAGALNLDPSLITGKTLINLDSENEGVFTVGCAGGGSVYITLPVTWGMQTRDEIAFNLKADGLQGGHSGEDINKHRANANKLIARILNYIQRDVPIRLAGLKGGTARNAIPRDAEAVFVCPKENAEALNQKFHAIVRDIRAEYAINEQDLSITLTQKNGEPVRVISREETQTGLRLLVSLPHGVSAMSADMPGFVETSNNIGIIELSDECLLLVSSQRSSVLSRLEEIIERVESLAWLAGATTERTTVVPPWQPDMESSLLKKCVETYEKVMESKPKVELTHGGLECGIISRRCGGLDTISLGPTIQNLHSPDERLYVPSLQRVWMFLSALLAE
ncbi:MAG: aminoacyl-histidine dipeptidase [Anaerolineales bacterium]|nr:MAG: aminoacyl-histidine dipeptidase [Anaerolineales bacterium]